MLGSRHSPEFAKSQGGTLSLCDLEFPPLNSGAYRKLELTIPRGQSVKSRILSSFAEGTVEPTKYRGMS